MMYDKYIMMYDPKYTSYGVSSKDESFRNLALKILLHLYFVKKTPWSDLFMLFYSEYVIIIISVVTCYV